MMIKKILIISLIIINFCSTKNKIQRQLNYNNRLDIAENEDGSLTIKSTICDITVQYIFEKKWDDFCKNFALNKTYLFSSQNRKPPLHFFIVCIHNTSYNLITPLSFYISKNDQEYNALKLTEFKNQFISPVYKNYNFKNIFINRRLTDGILQYELSKIDYQKESIQYNFNFILPDDKIIFIKAFDKKNTIRNNFKLNILLKYKNIKKTIDFDIRFSEYRTE